MIKNILNIFGEFFKSEEQNADLHTPPATSVTFILSHSTTTIGELTLENGLWTFRYTDAFKAQQRLSPIVDFSDVHKVYRSAHLFPYFEFRIPSTSRPQIKRIIKEKNIDGTNLVELLKTFGQRTIVNPFELQMA